jgi:hypothetical protein
LLGDAGIQDLFWFSPLFILSIEALHPPAEQAVVGALVDYRGHLQAAVGLDAVELLLVAWSAF